MKTKHHLLTLMLSQTCLPCMEHKTYFEECWYPSGFRCHWFPLYGQKHKSLGPKTAWLPIFFKISYFVFHKRKSTYMGMSKWQQSVHSGGQFLQNIQHRKHDLLDVAGLHSSTWLKGTQNSNGYFSSTSYCLMWYLAEIHSLKATRSLQSLQCLKQSK